MAHRKGTSPTTMSQPIESVARIASTPAQAKIFLAMLHAEGIPARVDGDSLVDEFAASQRLMNLVGTRVMVPTSALQRAQEILQPVTVDPEELARAAAVGAPPPPPDPGSTEAAKTATANATRNLFLALLALAIGAAVLFAFLWHRAVNAIAGLSPDLRLYWDGNALCEERIRDQKLLFRRHDHDQDGLFERLEWFGGGTKPVAVYDQYADGLYLRLVEQHPDGLTTTWTDDDRNGIYDTCIVTDRDGKQVQALRWQPGTGFVQPPK
jgi:hypothetical protein